jgi:putative heme-binding domain-containing protein
VQGAYYWKSFGKHGPLHNPHAYGYFDHVPHANFQGGHVSVGGVIYHGDNLPEKFRGKFISPDLLDHSVHWHDVTPDGSSYKSAHGGDLLKANDTWFASSDATMGPDGAIYVADFHDQRTAHPDPDAEWDRSNGRVYRISSKLKKFDAGPDYSKLSNDDLIGMLSKRDNWVSRKARREFANRRDPQVIEPLKKRLREQGDVETLWALYVSGGFDEELAKQTLTHENPDVRWWTVRFLGDEEKVSPGIAAKLVELASADTDLQVRSQLACTAKRLPATQGLRIVERIVARDLDGNDPQIPLLLWWAVERHCVADLKRSEEFFRSTRKSKLAWNAILPRLARRYAAEGTAETLEACARMLDSAPGPGPSHALVQAIDQGLSERPTKPSDALLQRLASAVRESWSDDSANPVLTRLFARLGDRASLERARAHALDPKQPADVRVSMIEILGEFGTEESETVLLELLRTPGEPEAVHRAALSTLQRYEDEAVARELVALYRSLPAGLRPKAIDVLAGRPGWALRLLDAIDSGGILPGDVSAEQLAQVALHHDKTLDARIAKRWGKITGGTPEEKLAEVRRLNNDLRAAPGDKASGKAIYMNTCGTCHKLFNEGGAVGPDLSHANRTDRNYLLVSIVDPSSVVRAEFLNYLCRTTDGRVLSGLLVDQNPASVTLLDAKGERITVARDKVQILKESPVSLMPEGLLSALTPQQLRDLFAYLQSNTN